MTADKDNRYGFVYIWYDRKHKLFYVGSHWGTENDGYICSSDWMRKAYKHRPKDFKRRILRTRIPTRVQLYEEEQRWLDMIRPEERKIKYYNLTLSTKQPWYNDDNYRKTVGARISASKKGKNTGPRDPSVGIKISESKRRNIAAKQAAGLPVYTISDKVIAANARKIGTSRSAESISKTSESLKKHYQENPVESGSRVLSEETKQKIGNAHRGMKRSEETCKNIAAGNSKQFRVTYRDGRAEVITGLKAFALSKDIPYVTLHKAFKMQKPVHKYDIVNIINII